ncbi:peptidase C15 pyroglutamyl peptidase I-like protein [Armillaria nabsnona]|nr:peptidase C15 pyroglutamyl peptidase I-like protein [Armillaria nabsnona]
MSPHPDTRPAKNGGTYNVLLTGFGVCDHVHLLMLVEADLRFAQPFGQYKENPSWLAVRPLQNTLITLDPHPDPIVADPTASPAADGPAILNEEPKRLPPAEIRISTLEIPVEYETIMKIVPGLHARPPVLPEQAQGNPLFPAPPERGYDFIFHIGAAGRGPLRMEKLAHKTGYHMKDASGNYAPTSNTKKSEEVNGAAAAAGVVVVPEGQPRLPSSEIPPETAPLDSFTSRVHRGYGHGYERFTDELLTDIDVTRLVQDMKLAGIEHVYSSMDAGHYLCDFIYYGSLAEAQRNRKPYDKSNRTRVLFMHCPPVNQPCSTEDVTDAIKQIIVWVCEDGGSDS